MNMKKLAVIGALLIVLGGIVFTGALAASGWQISKLSTNGPLEDRSMTIQNKQQDIVLIERDTPIVIGRSDDNDIHLEYAESKRAYYIIKDEDTLLINKEYKPLAFFFNFDFNFTKPLTLLLPKDFQGNIKVKNANGGIELSQLDLQELELITSNGRVTVEQLTAKALVVKSSNAGMTLDTVQVQDEIICNTSNGKLQLSDITTRDFVAKTTNASVTARNIYTDDSITLESSNGRIDIEDLLAGKELSLITNNASITGSIRDSMRNYSIQSKTSNANNNLPEDMSGGPKDLTVKTSNGPIKLTFDESAQTPPQMEKKDTKNQQNDGFSVRD